MNKVIVVAIAAMMVIIGAFAYHVYTHPSHPPTFKQYNLNIVMNSAIGSLAINNRVYSNLGGHWFNTTMTGYNNYTVSFPYLVEYGGYVNSTLHVYLDHNTTVLLDRAIVNLSLSLTTDAPNTSLIFQQMIHLNRSAGIPYSSINPSFDNLAFYYNNGTPIYAWLESINQYGNATIWLKLDGCVNRTIDVKILNQTANGMSASGYYGEAPQLSATYGEYDNGASVFPFYDNFAGTTLSSKWTVPSSSIYKVNNGFIAEPSAGSTTAVYAASVQETSSIITEWLLNFDGVTFPQTSSYWQLNRYTAGSNMHFLGSSGNDNFRNNNVSIASVSVPSSGLQIYGVWNDGTIVRWFYPDGNYTDTTAASITDYVSLGWSVNSTTTNFPTIYWVRTRAYPPNGVMPFILISQWQSGGE